MENGLVGREFKRLGGSREDTAGWTMADYARSRFQSAVKRLTTKIKDELAKEDGANNHGDRLQQF